MKVVLNIIYDTKVDQDIEASKLDRFRQKLYGEGIWGRADNGGLEITL